MIAACESGEEVTAGTLRVGQQALTLPDGYQQDSLPALTYWISWARLVRS
jgi:hypothetical protein